MSEKRAGLEERREGRERRCGGGRSGGGEMHLYRPHLATVRIRTDLAAEGVRE